jgi:formylglycine-generating enzyme required for sulfatase activity
LSRLIEIFDSRGSRILSDNDLPLSAGGSPDAHVFLSSSRETEGYIGDSHGHLFFQPAGTSPVYHNDQHITDSVWIKSGDTTRVGLHLIHYEISGDRVGIKVSSTAEKTTLVPPETPHPETLTSQKKLPRTGAAGEGKKRRFRSKLMQFAGAVFVILLVAAVFVLAARPLEISITPEPDSISIAGFPPVIRLGQRYLGLKGEYTLQAEKKGYRPLEVPVTISPDQGANSFSFSLEKLPGIVSFYTRPVDEAEVFVNNTSIGMTPLEKIELPAGEQTVRIVNERYQIVEQVIAVKGLGRKQRFEFVLSPAWSTVEFTSEPSGAEVVIDSRIRGTTPLVLDILEGTYSLVFQKKDYSPMAMDLTVPAGEELSATAVLTPAPANLDLQSTPPGATVMVDALFKGQTPLSLTLSSRMNHTLELSLPGFENLRQKMTFAPGENKSLHLEMKPEYGTVFVTTAPPDAELLIDGKPHGKATGRLELSVQQHTLEVRARGYKTATRTVTPNKEYARQVEIQLEPEKSTAAPPAKPARQQLPGGMDMILVQPASFEMGTSRREPGRRSNERLRQVRITRPYYISAREVTNAEFRRFKPGHSSGTVAGFSLDGEKQPAVNVSWEDAVRYLNWLSRRDGLEPFYREENGKFVPASPLTTGYRLPFESEWAYVARYMGNSRPARYPWSGSFPPPALSGNFADESSRGILATVIRGYNDSFPVTAPVAGFPRNQGGFFDIGGNVSEWCHDFYTPYISFSGKPVDDPMGPDSGVHHVVRGSSWRDGSVTELRLTYRSYSNRAQDDIGFRVARFAR